MITTSPNVLDQLAAAWALAEPVTPAPITPAPIHRGPIDPGPIHRGPITPAPIHRGPIDPGPIHRGPIDPAPITKAPTPLEPIHPAPIDTAPAPIIIAPPQPGPTTPPQDAETRADSPVSDSGAQAGVLAPIRLERPTPICDGHVSPFDLIDERDPKRPGYIRSTCRACGRFIGYRRDDR